LNGGSCGNHQKSLGRSLLSLREDARIDEPRKRPRGSNAAREKDLRHATLVHDCFGMVKEGDAPTLALGTGMLEFAF